MLSNLKKRDLQPKQELGDTQKQADDLNLGQSAAGEGCREMNQRWEQVFSLVPLSFLPWFPSLPQPGVPLNLSNLIVQ